MSSHKNCSNSQGIRPAPTERRTRFMPLSDAIWFWLDTWDRLSARVVTAKVHDCHFDPVWRILFWQDSVLADSRPKHRQSHLALFEDGKDALSDGMGIRAV